MYELHICYMYSVSASYHVDGKNNKIILQNENKTNYEI